MRDLDAGPSPKDSPAALILVHGRGGAAENMMNLYVALDVPWCAALALQAPGNTWYPHSFFAPLEANQPFLDRSLAMLNSTVTRLLTAGFPSERIAILGFSQGACLTLEFAARNPRRYGTILALTGGLIGPPGTPRNYPGSLAGTPVYLSAGDPDPHVPFRRVEETRDALTAMGAAVDMVRFPGKPHSIDQVEISACRALLLPLDVA